MAMSGLLGLGAIGGYQAAPRGLLGLGGPSQSRGLLDFAKSPGTSDALFALSQALMAYGSGNPQAIAQVPAMLAERQRYRKDDARLAKMDQHQEQVWRQQEEERQRTANQRRATEEAWASLSGGVPGSMPGGLLSESAPSASNPAFRGPKGYAPPAEGAGSQSPRGLLDSFDPTVSSYLKAYGAADPGGAMNLVGEQLFKDPAAKPSSVQEYEYAKTQGFAGTIFDYQKAKAEAGRAPAQVPESWSVVGGQLVSSRGDRKALPGDENPLGNSFDANSINFLVNGNPADPMYAAVYNQMSQPRVTYNPATGETVTIAPDMSPYRKPGQQQGGGQPGQTVPQPGPMSGRSTGEQLPPPSLRGGSMSPDPMLQGPKAGPTPAGVTVEQTTIPGLDKTAKAKVTDARVDARSIISSLDDFATAYKGAGYSERGKSIAGFGTGLNTKYNIAALLSKAESLFNLGVLNGPDLDIIRRTITDPSTLASIGTDSTAIDAQVTTVKRLVQQRLNEREREYGLPITDFGQSSQQDATPATPGGKVVKSLDGDGW